MSGIRTRLSMNTLLKNAKIFEEDSTENPSLTESTSTHYFEFNSENVKVKEEPNDEEWTSKHSKKPRRETFPEAKIKEENVVIKQEPKELGMDEDTMFPCNIFDKLNLKKEVIEQYLSPVKLEADDNTSSSMDSNSRKSAKRTVFPRESPYKTRQSPYKRPSEIEPNQGTSLHTKADIYDRVKTRNRKSPEMETDPEVLRRRQKQIDYGKNTIGYDIYTKTVKRYQRTETDPQTPNKYLKYSRRGFDGLIKQWRLKLHKYDPPEAE